MSLQERRYVRLMRQVLYGLKAQYGAPVVAYKLQDAETNYITGVKTVQKSSYPIVGVVIPTQISREVLQSISQISANKTMVYGGTFDSLSKTFILDGRDFAADFDFTNDDWIVYNNHRFEIKKIIRLDYNAGWIIEAQAIEGQHAEQIIHLQASSLLCNLNGVGAVVNFSTHHPGATLSLDQDLDIQVIRSLAAESQLALDQSLYVGHTFSTLTGENVLTLNDDITPGQVIKVMHRSAESDENITLKNTTTNAIAVKVMFRDLDPPLTLDQDYSLKGSVWNREGLDDLELQQQADFNGVWARDGSDTLTLNQTVGLSKVTYVTAGNTLALSHVACTLGTGLISAWHLDEIGGTRYDAWGNNDLSDINTVGWHSGIVGNSAHFTDTNNEQLTVDSNASLQTGDIDFMFTCWLRIDDWASEYRLLCKWNESTSNREFMLLSKTNGQLVWYISRNGTLTTSVTHTSALETGVWHFVCVYHDAVNNEIGISLHNDAPTTISTALGVYSGTAPFTLSGDAELQSPVNGDIDAVHFWKRILSTAEVSAMYNGGAGRQIPPITCD